MKQLKQSRNKTTWILLLNFHDTCSFKYFVQSYFNYFKYFYHWKETNSVGVIWCIFITFYTNWFKWKMIWYLIAKKADHPALNIHTHTCVIMLFVQTIIFRMTRAECFKMTQISCQRDSLNIFILQSFLKRSHTIQTQLLCTEKYSPPFYYHPFALIVRGQI